MSKKRKKRSTVRAEPTTKRSGFYLCSPSGFEDILCSGYTRLSDNPEIVAAVDAIARLIASMTIHLMENTDKGDVRVKNALSKKVDIEPNGRMTRSAFVYWIVKTMILNGGNAVVYPKTANGYLEDLVPIPPSAVEIVRKDIYGYSIYIGGVEYDPSELLHFVLNPRSDCPYIGEGYKVPLREVANNLKQAAKTEKSFMESKWKPSLIIKVDALADEFAGPAGREKLLEEYIATNQIGEPWLIPAEQFSVEQVKPLSLADLALSDMVELDKRTAAAIIGVPSFVVGVGEFNRNEWNNFISGKVMSIAKIIEQVLTRGLIYKPEWFFRFNSRALYNYDLKELAAVADDQYVRGIMDGNEVRDWLGMSPREGLDELIILENYIPRGMIGQQSKLVGGEE